MVTQSPNLRNTYLSHAQFLCPFVSEFHTFYCASLICLWTMCLTPQCFNYSNSMFYYLIESLEFLLQNFPGCSHLFPYLYVVVQSLVSDSLQPHGLQHARLLHPPLSPGVCTNSCPLSRWCHPTVSSSVIPFSCLQSFPFFVWILYEELI